MDLNFVLKCDAAELKHLIKIIGKKVSEKDRIAFLKDRIFQTEQKIGMGVLNEDWPPIKEKIFYAANKCSWAAYKTQMPDASMRFSPKANIEERTKFYSRIETKRKKLDDQTTG